MLTLRPKHWIRQSFTRPLKRLLNKTLVHSKARQGHSFKVHFGCGQDYLEGYVNVDTSAASRADIVADDLDFFPPCSLTVIETYHVFEHFDLIEARYILRRWHTLLGDGGQLVLELPNLDVCIAELGKHFNQEGYDLAMAGIFSYPPFVHQYGEPMTHKWGWTPATLAAELYAAGFSHVEERPVKQTWRKGAEFNRDMQIVAIK
jgi:hypothetical protein